MHLRFGILVFLSFLISTPSLAQGLSSLQFGSMPPMTLIKLSGMRQHNDRQERLDTSLITPLYHNDTHKWIANASYKHMNIRPNASGFENLYDTEVGLSYFKTLKDKKSLGFTASFGSASDKPFKETSVNTLSLNALYSFPQTATKSWLFVLNYSNNRPILNNIPLPFFIFSYVPSKKLRSSFGPPFASVFWKFHPRWSMSLFTLVPWVLKGEFAYSIKGPIQAFAGLNFSQEVFRAHDRPDPDIRLFYEEQKLFVGIKSPLNRFLFAELEFGNSFNRTLFQAENYTRNPDNPTYLDSSLYGKVTLSARF